MKDMDKLATSTFTRLLVLTTATAIINTSYAAAAPKMEKCYGIVKAGMNDCQTKTASCAGSSTKDRQPDAYLLLPSGTCKKIVDGSLTEK
jgi:uncharacterized membrane protein